MTPGSGDISSMYALSSAQPEGPRVNGIEVLAFCDHLEVLLRSRVLTRKPSRFLTSNVKMDWEVSTIIEALRENYPLRMTAS